MRTILIIPMIFTLPFTLVMLLRTLTGDPISSVILGLTVSIVLVAWFAGAEPAKRGRVGTALPALIGAARCREETSGSPRTSQPTRPSP